MTHVKTLSAHGIVYPLHVIRAAEKTGLALSLACAFLEQESGGGHNVFGHDKVKPPQIKGGNVTRARYRHYKALRATNGAQGVGPMQLTSLGLQDLADRLGGCWRPSINMEVGFDTAAGLIRQYGKAGGIRRYNGSGPAARLYSIRVRSKARKWHRRLTK